MQEFGPSSAFVNIVTQNNETFSDAFQFDPPSGCTGCTGATGPSWSLSNQNFRMDIKGNRQQPAALLSITSAAGQIIVDDVVNRIVHFNVPETVLLAALVPGEYVYDFVMYSNDNPPIRLVLMHGGFKFGLGVTGG